MKQAADVRGGVADPACRLADPVPDRLEEVAVMLRVRPRVVELAVVCGGAMRSVLVSLSRSRHPDSSVEGRGREPGHLDTNQSLAAEKRIGSCSSP